MNETYVEVLIKKKTPSSDKIIAIGLLIITIGFFLSFFLFQTVLLPVAGVIMCIVDYFVFISLDLEYEYLYVNGALQIDKIMGKQKRKQYLDLNMENVEAAAPKGSSHLDEYRKKKAVIKDCTSGKDENSFIIMYKSGKELWEVHIEPNPKIIEAMRLTAPRKVFLK